MKSLLQNLAVLGVAVLVCLIGAEGLFRAFPQFLGEEAFLRLHWQELDQSASDQAMTLPDRHLGFLYRPGFTGRLSRGDLDFSFTTDAHGFRNPSPWPKQADVVVVGDSMAFGYGVDDDDAWPRLVADALPNLEVINLGLIGAAPQQYLRVLEAFGLDLDPELVLFMLFPGNDLFDAWQFQRWLDAAPEQTYQQWQLAQEQPGGLGPLSQVLQSSRLVAFLRGARKSLSASAASSVIDFEDGGSVRLTPALLQSNIEMARPGDPVFKLVMATIERAQAVTRERGGHFLVLLMPTKEEVYLPRTGQPAPPLVESFQGALAERGIDLLDLTPHFQAHARDAAPLFHEIDGHPNIDGSRLIARVVADHLKESGPSYGLPDSSAQPRANRSP